MESSKRRVGHHGRAGVIAVTSGVLGRETAEFSIELGHRLAPLGKRVMVVDAVHGPGGVCACLERAHGRTAGARQLHSGAAGKEGMPLCHKAVARALQPGVSSFHYLLIDCGPARIPGAIGLVARADEILIVLTPEPAAVFGAKRMVRRLALDHSRTEFLVVTAGVADEPAGAALFHDFRSRVERSVPAGLVHLGVVAGDAGPSPDIAESLLLFRDYLVADLPASGGFFPPEIQARGSLVVV